MKITIFAIVSLIKGGQSNLRCFSCAPCNEWQFNGGWRDPGRWEMDCPLDRYCMKISGIVQDQFGYGNQVSFRGCPWISLFTQLEEGCTSQTLDISGVGRITGEVCLCGDHLCNSAQQILANIKKYSFIYALLFIIVYML